ncbi:hypothetical protein T265_13510, partial [Opisthorchis viverrini]
MNFHLHPVQAVRLVSHWFSHWSDWEREVFLDSLSSLEQTNCYLSVGSPVLDVELGLSTTSVMDMYLANLMHNGLQILPESPSPTVFECQLRLFQTWYPEWPLEQKVQLAEHLKRVQLQALNDVPGSFEPNQTPL